MRLRKGDRVVSPYAGRELVGGATAPAHGVVRCVSRGFAYVDFSVGTEFTAIPVADLEPLGHRVWKEAR